MSEQQGSNLGAVGFYFGMVSLAFCAATLTALLHDRPQAAKTAQTDPCEMATAPHKQDENRAMKMLECGLRHGFALRHP